MGGEVTMESEEGRGTTMRLIVALPVGDPELVVPEPTFSSMRFVASRPTPSRRDAIRERSLVLVAEDHSVNRAVLLHQLDAIGFCADAADDGSEALELFERGDYAFVLTDLHMPRLSGYELAEAIRRHEAVAGWPRTPIMALTANVMHGEPQRCQEAGMDDFAAKPTTIPLLAAKLRQWLPHLDLTTSVVDRVDEDGTDDGTENGAADGNDGPLDRTVLVELTGGDAALALTILRDFVEVCTSDVARLEQALTSHDRDEVRLQAHRIKGASGVVGAKHIAELAARIETLADSDSTGEDGLRTLVEDAAAALALVADEVQRGPERD
jgi:CheY-like chemotaxis protein/HPt (histidine-containing phosphotransfer) domain-containing protein